ncbi:MAG: peptidylprolyl isomerase [Bacteroidota bacterium]|nr:peptidylprolyl isomerase [Bacteroidota bacterium]
MKLYRIIIVLTCICQFLTAQRNDPVLFTVAETPIYVSEFEYIYNKNNGKEADYSQKSLEEYLNLYSKFKLKVQAAREMKLDTIPALIKELEGYRQQLTTNYLNDKEVTDRLAKEVYDRQKKDLRLSHILFSLSPNALPEDTAKSYKMAMDAYQSLKSGVKFEEVARKVSNDLSSASNGGMLGWFTAMLPEGFYNLENEAYSLKPGEFSMPFRTKLGYQLIKLNAERPARRKIEVAHILIRKGMKNKPDVIAQLKVDSIYQLIKKGASFEEFARNISDDKNSSGMGGNIGYFGINQYEAAFEDEAYKLAADGDYSKPVETSIGWHIIKRLRKEEELPYERAKRKIQADITKDSRFTLAQSTLIDKIKAEAKYKENGMALTRFVSQMDTNFFTYKWKVPDNLVKEELASLGEITVSSEQFAEFVKTNTRLRLQGSDTRDVKASVRKLFDEFVSQKCLQYEEGRLEEKYPDFKSLMREYREGILLFEATKNMVWDRASEDTSGLKTFYEKNKTKYRWDERAVLLSITIDTNNLKLAQKIYKFSKKQSIEKTIQKFDKENNYLSFQKTVVEKKNSDNLSGLTFIKNASSDLTKDSNGHFSFKKIEQILPQDTKSLDEARGYIIADYQDYLEVLWIDELKRKYPIKVNDVVLKSLVKN